MKLLSFSISQIQDYTSIFNQVKTIEEIVEKRMSVKVYMHSLRDSHQDHVTVVNAVKITRRRISQVLSFWSPSTYNYFRPEHFIDILEVVKDKSKILGKFKPLNQKDYLIIT